MTVAIGVPEMYAAAVRAARRWRAKIRIQALPGRAFGGKVTRTAYALDSEVSPRSAPRSTSRTPRAASIQASTPTPPSRSTNTRMP